MVSQWDGHKYLENEDYLGNSAPKFFKMTSRTTDWRSYFWVNSIFNSFPDKTNSQSFKRFGVQIISCNKLGSEVGNFLKSNVVK